MLSRRRFLTASSLTASALALAACDPRMVRVATPAGPRATLPRVLVSKERVIRTIVGLRPFRPSGFVVRAEKLDAKTVVHNYGHGGAGITLSWGTAHLAVREAAAIETRDAAVLGAGIVGLSTARLLQQRGYSVTIYTKAMPPETTSNIGGGYWDPVTLYDRPRVTAEFRRQLAEAARFAFRYYQSLAGEAYGVRWLQAYFPSDQPHAVAPPTSAYSEVEALFPEARELTPAENPFATAYAYRRYSMLIEPAIYLPALMRDFQIAGGRIVVREFAAARDLAQLRESLLFNCTGLGSRTLFNDNELIPIRGQLTFLIPQPEIQYMTLGPGDIYMFPRHDGILLGGSHERDNSNLDVDQGTLDRVLRESGDLFGRMK